MIGGDSGVLVGGVDLSKDARQGLVRSGDGLRRFVLTRVIGMRRWSLRSDAVMTVSILAAEVLLGALIDLAGLSDGSIAIVYVLGIFFISASTTRRIFRPVGLMLSLVTFDVLYVTPRFSLVAGGIDELGLLAMVFLVGVVLSFLTVQLRDLLRASQASSRRLHLLLETERQLQGCHDLDSIVQAVGTRLSDMLERDVLWFPVTNGTLGAPRLFGGGEGPVVVERAVAQRAFANKAPAGLGTDAFGSAQGVYVPLSNQDQVDGVVGILEGDQPFTQDERHEVLSVLGEASLALERNQAQADRAKADERAREEQVRAHLLRSISHDLRTPLTAIGGNAEVILDGGDSLDSATRTALAQDIYDDAVWLEGMVEKLLAVTRIQEGSVQLDLEPQLVDEVIEEALRHVSRNVRRHHLVVVPSQDVVLARMDARMVVQVIVNLINNAVDHTPEGSRIEVGYHVEGDKVQVSVTDDGPGVPEADKERIFQAFYTTGGLAPDGVRSVGLGLSLCKTIIEAQGGVIWVEDARPHGAAFKFTLPLEEMPQDVRQ